MTASTNPVITNNCVQIFPYFKTVVKWASVAYKWHITVVYPRENFQTVTVNCKYYSPPNSLIIEEELIVYDKMVYIVMKIDGHHVNGRTPIELKNVFLKNLEFFKMIRVYLLSVNDSPNSRIINSIL